MVFFSRRESGTKALTQTAQGQEGHVDFPHQATLFGGFVQRVPDEVSPASLGLGPNGRRCFTEFGRLFRIEVRRDMVEMLNDAVMALVYLVDSVFAHFLDYLDASSVD
jgi:hypothetical protein